MSPPFSSPDDAARALANAGYIVDSDLATTVFLAGALEKPILAEGPAGVGKTELAKSLATAMGTELVRLQCYEGLDEAKTLYEWKYAKQLLYTQMLSDEIGGILRGSASLGDAVERIAAQDDVFFSERFLEARPLLRALRSDRRVVLLIDEVDRAEDELEAFFLEVLAEYQVTIPELGTLRAKHAPMVILTSNDTRELSDALRRRCLYLPMAYPTPEREAQIIESRIPEVAKDLVQELAAFVASVRDLDLKKSPGISETIDWARALMALSARELDEPLVQQTLNLLLSTAATSRWCLSGPHICLRRRNRIGHYRNSVA